MLNWRLLSFSGQVPLVLTPLEAPAEQRSRRWKQKGSAWPLQPEHPHANLSLILLLLIHNCTAPVSHRSGGERVGTALEKTCWRETCGRARKATGESYSVCHVNSGTSDDNIQYHFKPVEHHCCHGLSIFISCCHHKMHLVYSFTVIH